MQRYEREMGFPIHRPAGQSRAAVVATKTELDKWLTSPSSQRIDSATTRRALDSRTNKLRVEFLKVDCNIVLTFAGIALTTTNPEKRRSTTESARKAYDTILRLRKGADLSVTEADKLEANLRRLKGKLHDLGQRF